MNARRKLTREDYARRIIYNARTLAHPHARRVLTERERHQLSAWAIADARAMERAK